MIPSNDDIVCIAKSVLSTMVNIDAEQTIDLPLTNDNPMSGFIEISGAWTGKVVLQTNEELVRQIGEVMMGIPANDLEFIDLVDVLSEITNMIGGNIKSQVPGPSDLSIPQVLNQASDHQPCTGTHAIHQIPLLCNNKPMNIVVMEASV